MLNSSILDVAIGMAFIYLLLSLIASTVQEIIASVLQTRSANLERGIRSLFSGGELANGVPFIDRLYRHGLIMGLYREHIDPAGKVVKKVSPYRNWLRRLFRIQPSSTIPDVSDPFYLPAYIPTRTFAIALLDILKVEAEKAKTVPQPPSENGITADPANAVTPGFTDPLQPIGDYLETLCVRQKVAGSPTAYAAAEAMLSLLRDARDIDGAIPPIEKFRCHLENWYNDSMDRASGWYKKYTQNVLLIVGLILAIVFNVDSINVGKKLWFDKDARAGLIQAASTYVDTHTVVPATAGHPARVQAKTDPAATPQPDAVQPNTDNVSSASSPGEVKLTTKELAEQMKTTVQAFNDVSETYLLPVGWHYSVPEYSYLVTHPDKWRGAHILSQIAGWCMTAIALSLGAPFWFDLLNKFMVVRSTVKPSEKSRTEASKDAT